MKSKEILQAIRDSAIQSVLPPSLQNTLWKNGEKLDLFKKRVTQRLDAKKADTKRKR
jgi:hypothetical protein